MHVFELLYGTSGTTTTIPGYKKINIIKFLPIGPILKRQSHCPKKILIMILLLVTIIKNIVQHTTGGGLFGGGGQAQNNLNNLNQMGQVVGSTVQYRLTQTQETANGKTVLEKYQNISCMPEYQSTPSCHDYFI